MTRECHLLHGDDAGFKDSVKRFFRDTWNESEQEMPAEEVLRVIWIANDLLGTNFEVDSAELSRLIGNNTPDEFHEMQVKFMVSIVLHFVKQVSKYAPLLLVVVKHQFMSADDWFITHAVSLKIQSGKLRNVSLLLAGWPQRNKSFSDRYSHRDAAKCYKNFIAKFC